MVRHGSQVITTQMVSTQDAITSDGSFHFSNMITVHDLAPDFMVIVEVYGLQTFRHRVEKHAGKRGIKEKGTLRLTPRKKASRTDMRAITTQSPGGPNAVLSSSFGLIGYQQITNRNVGRRTWQFDKVPHESPLVGTIDMKVQCHTDFTLEEKGFLTMFEDVSGFGAWHRRWFVLNTTHLTYWKYPDDEKRKDPMGEVDLRHCITDTVGLVPRDVCARPNTFMLVTARQPSNGDRSSLIEESYNTYTATRHLLSADTKEERILWSDRLNIVLSNLRVWDPAALKPAVMT
jgi:actin-binding protein anillin